MAQWHIRNYGAGSLNDLNGTQLKFALQQTENKIKTGHILTGIGVGSGLISGVLFVNNFCIFSCSSNENLLATTGTVLFIGGFFTLTFGVAKWIVNVSRKNNIELALVKFNPAACTEVPQSSAFGLNIKMVF